MADYDLYYWPVPFRGQFIRADPRPRRQALDRARRRRHRRPHALRPSPTSPWPSWARRCWSTKPPGRPRPDARDRGLPRRYAGADRGRPRASRPHREDRQRRQRRDRRTHPRRRPPDVDEAEVEGLRPPPGGMDGDLGNEAARHGRGATTPAGCWATKQPGVADIVTSTLWSTMGDRFPPLQEMLDETAPAHRRPVPPAAGDAAAEGLGEEGEGGLRGRVLRRGDREVVEGGGRRISRRLRISTERVLRLRSSR